VRAFKAMDVIELNARTAGRQGYTDLAWLIPFCGTEVKNKCLYPGNIFKKYVAPVRNA
jgi:hypothetical protein